MRHTPLCASRFPLSQHEHTPGLRQFSGGAQPGDSSADHYEVGLGWKTLHERRMVPL